MRIRQSIPLIGLLLFARYGGADERHWFGASASIGLDSNPAQRREASALAFARYSLDAGRRTRWRLLDIEGVFAGWYRDYEGANDSYRLAAQGRYLQETQQGRGLLSLALDAALYRDQLVAADERNEAALRLRYDFLSGARDELGIALEYRALAYRNSSLPWAGRPGGVNKRLSSARAQQEQKHRAVRRDERSTRLLFDVVHHWTQTLSGALNISFARLDSNAPAEAYRRYGAALQTDFELTPDWLLAFTVAAYYSDYDQAPRQWRRQDRLRFADLALRRTMGAAELICAVSYQHNASSIDVKSFRQTVSECGLLWFF
jgi:hypothetical protein